MRFFVQTIRSGQYQVKLQNQYIPPEVEGVSNENYQFGVIIQMSSSDVITRYICSTDLV
jgi:hypothetical protein